jgi:hypothetical protein
MENLVGCRIDNADIVTVIGCHVQLRLRSVEDQLIWIARQFDSRIQAELIVANVHYINFVVSQTGNIDRVTPFDGNAEWIFTSPQPSRAAARAAAVVPRTRNCGAPACPT